MPQTNTEVPTPTSVSQIAKASNVCSLSADAFLGQWTTFPHLKDGVVQQNVLVERRGDDQPNLLKATLTWETKEGKTEKKELAIVLDNKQQWRCGNGELVVDPSQDPRSQISWWGKNRKSTWYREKSWSDVAKDLKPESSTVECSAIKQTANGLIADDFLGQWKWQENGVTHDVTISYLEGSNGRLQASISKLSKPLVLGPQWKYGSYDWWCGDGCLDGNTIEYAADNKQVKALHWVFHNETTNWYFTSNWTRVLDSSAAKKSVAESDSGSTDEGTEENKDGTWFLMTQEWENEKQPCALKQKIRDSEAHKGKQDKSQAKNTKDAQWGNQEWVHSRWVDGTGYQKPKTTRASQNKTAWKEVDGWKHNNRKGGRGQQYNIEYYQ
jgi:hypothetical protein